MRSHARPRRPVLHRRVATGLAAALPTGLPTGLATAAIVAVTACSQPGGEPTAAEGADASPRTTLLGDPVRPPAYGPEVQERLEKDLEIARAVMEVAPEREHSWIWLGRRYGYLARYPEAIDVFTRGIERFPDSYKLYRFRARHLARDRQFGRALADYRRALELMEGHPDSFEPDGIINARHQYLGTYRSNIHYYTAQTSWAVGDYETVVAGMERARAEPLNRTPDYTVPNAYWRYMGLRKLGRDDEAQAAVAEIPDEMDLVENHTYHRGVRYLEGSLTREEALEGADNVVRFAVAMKDRFDGDEERATELLRAIVQEDPQGFWPAEVELVGPVELAGPGGG